MRVTSSSPGLAQVDCEQQLKVTALAKKTLCAASLPRVPTLRPSHGLSQPLPQVSWPPAGQSGPLLLAEGFLMVSGDFPTPFPLL